MTYKKDEFCNYCGTWLPQNSYPKKCIECNNHIYTNPLPVTVPIIFCAVGNQVGILVVKRNIEPKKGQWALPGGYLEQGETWQEGSARESLEETGIILDPSKFKLVDVVTSTNGNLLIFSYYMLVYLDQIKLIINNEVSDFKVIFEPEELAFPTHTEMVRRMRNPK